MGRKAKYSAEQKIQACEDYLSGKKSAKQIAKELEMGQNGELMVRRWSGIYKVNGSEIFNDKPHNRSYSKEFKEKVVKEYLAGQGSLSELQVKYCIPSKETIRRWISMYNKHIDMKDYDYIVTSIDNI